MRVPYLTPDRLERLSGKYTSKGSATPIDSVLFQKSVSTATTMYVCQRREQVRVNWATGRSVGWRVIFFRVELNGSGRPIWRETGQSGDCDHPHLARRRYGIKGVL